MTTTLEKYTACMDMLRSTLESLPPAKMALFAGPEDDQAQRCALYASACGLAEAAISFAVLTDDADFDDAKVREQAKDPRWVAAQPREVLAGLFAKTEAVDDGR